MLRQSSSRNRRSKKFRATKHSFQVVVLFAVGIWIVYQLTHSYGKRRAVVVETDDGNGMGDGEPARRRLGRKGFVGFAGHAYADDLAWVSGRSDAGSEGVEGAGGSSDPLSKAGDGEGGESDEEDQEADEDDGVDGDVDDEDDGLTADEDDDDRDFQSHNGSVEEEPKIAHGETDGASELGLGNGDAGARLLQRSESNSSAVPRANCTGRVQDGVAAGLLNAIDGASAANGTAMVLSGSAPENASFVDASLHDRGRTGDVAKKLPVDGLAVGAPGAENEKSASNAPPDEVRMINLNGTADSVAGHGIST